MTTQPRLVGGRYELGELIGYGGMAEVHRGRDARLGREVAIKVLRADLARDPSFLARFRREAQAAAGLNHPSIVSVYDTGEDIGPDGVTQPYIVMEYVEGRTLRDIVKTEGPMPARRAMEVTADVCSALDFSHRNGIVHRDVKPANVMITHTGAVKVMDFGIARALADNAATVTQTANVIGTAQYLSPEQARGEPVDARSDVYSTGCLLYELVTGAPPFQGDSPVAVAFQHVRENAAAPSTRNPAVPSSLDSIVMKALAKNPLNRYQSAGEMRTDLQRALANQPVAAEAVMTDAERTQFIARAPVLPVALAHGNDSYAGDPDDPRRSGLIWAAIVIALLLVIGAAAYLIVFLGRSPKVATATVPSLYGMPPQAATSTLQGLGFKPAQGADTNGPCDGGRPGVVGTVCTQVPASLGGTDKAAKGSTVTFSLYTPKMDQVPNVVGQPLNAATNALHQAGLVAAQPISVDSQQPAGTVLKQNPLGYTSAAPGSPVTLTVSNGKVLLPNVQGKKIADARLALNQGGWTNVTTDPTPVLTTVKAQDGTVAGENPSPNVSYPQTTQITLTVYKYSPPAPTCTTPPPTTAPPTTAPPTTAPPTTSPPTLPSLGPPSPSPSPSVTSSSPGGLPACPTP